MAKKYKSKNEHPNAPDLQTILLESPIGQQPPHNPYYPDLAQASPPPYTDLSTTQSTRMSTTNNNMNDPKYQRFNNAPAGHPTIIVQQPIGGVRDFTYSRYTDRIRKCNKGLVLNSILAIILSILTLYLYSLRPCVYKFVIHQPTPEIEVTVEKLRGESFGVIGLSVLLLVVGLIKSMIGYSKSSGCYLFIVALLTIWGTLMTGYMTYLSYYSPCVSSFEELATKGVKTLVSNLAKAFNEKVSDPQRGFFAETSVFNYLKEDYNGVIIFVINACLCLTYFSKFIEAITIC